MTTQFDLPIEELRAYRPEVAEPDDFEEFWSERLDDARGHPLDVEATRFDCSIRSADVYDVRFSGHGGSRIAAWMLMPRDCDPAAPVVIEFIGYNGGRGRPVDWLNWSSAGYPHIVVDSRGQGGLWRTSDTYDPTDPGEPGSRSFLARGLSSPDAHYYTRLFVDAARAMEVPQTLPATSGRPLVVTGGSQGGGLTLAAAHLARNASLVMPEVPFLAHFRRAATITDAEPYSEIAEYCAVYPERIDRVFQTLSYIDVVNHARRITVPALFSVGLLDMITPPSTVFAAFNHYGGDRRIEVYEFNGHEGGGSLHFERQVQFVRDRLGV